MTQGSVRKTLMTVFVATFMVSVAAMAQTTCTAAGAAGSYGFLETGTIINVGPRVAVGILKLDAAGNLTGSITQSVNGAVSHDTVRATFTVNPDCTGSLTRSVFDDSGNLNSTGTAALAWHSNMKAVDLIFTSLVLANGTSLATAISGTAKKVD